MNRAEASAAVGKMVISQDPGHKMVRRVKPHGPYLLLRVTKSGHAVLKGREQFRVPTSLISL